MPVGIVVGVVVEVVRRSKVVGIVEIVFTSRIPACLYGLILRAAKVDSENDVDNVKSAHENQRACDVPVVVVRVGRNLQSVNVCETDEKTANKQ